MERFGKITSDVLKKVKPKDAEIKKNIDMYLRIRQYIESDFKKEALLVGSVGKDTFLSGDNDLDIFVFFSPDKTKSDLEKEGLDIGKKVFRKFRGKYSINYAEHPYVKGEIEGFRVEIVPAYRIKSTKELKSAVDRTPFHSRYVIENLKAPDEVRLLKRFLKGIDCYGSDLKTLGFSGYLCELLILKYKSFESTLKVAQSWRYQEIIDMENHHTKEQYKSLRHKFKNQPLIFIDPTDRNRNVAAVLSKEIFARFIFMARMFMKRPEITYFFPKKEEIDKKNIIKELKVRKTKIIAITFKKPDIIDDILYPQLRRFKQRLTGVLAKEGFNIINAHEFADIDCGIAIEIQNGDIAVFKEKEGPRIFDPLKNQEKFAKKHKIIWFKDDRFMSETKRKHSNIEDFIRDWLKKDISTLEEQGVPKNIAEFISKRFRIIKCKDLPKINSEELWRIHLKEKIRAY